MIMKVKMFGKQLNVPTSFHSALNGLYGELKDFLLVGEKYHAMRAVAGIVSMLSSSTPSSANARFVIDVCRCVLRDLIDEKDCKLVYNRIVHIELNKYSTYDYDYIITKRNAWTGETEEIVPRKFEV